MTDTRNMTLPTLAEYHDPKPDSALVTVPNGLLQPDRQDGDGLRARLVAFSDFLNEPPQYEELRMVRDYRHEACAKWLPLIVELIAKFDTPPTRDAAEVAGNNSDGLCPVPPAKTSAVSTQTACETEGVSNDSAAARRMPDSERIGSLAPAIAATRCENGVSPGPSETAPPQPAPDAMRSLAANIQSKLVQLRHYRDHDCQLDHAKTIAEGRIIQLEQVAHWLAAEYAAAPVPPPDGATAQDCWHELVEKTDRTSPEEYPEMALITFEELRDFIDRAVPSATGAAEPVADERAIKLAHQICTGELSAVQGAVEIIQYATDGVLQMQAVATLPVRGDREAIKAIRQDVVMAIAFLTRDGNTDRITETVRQLIPRLASADEKLRAILSLPVQHGAGEREGIARLSASEVACYRWPEDSTEHRALRLAFMDGAAHTVTMWTPDIEGMVSGPYKYEKDLRTSFRVSIPGRDGRLVACVYATAGEDQAEADAELFARALRQPPQSSREG